jgi:hypothetical protein
MDKASAIGETSRRFPGKSPAEIEDEINFPPYCDEVLFDSSFEDAGEARRYRQALSAQLDESLPPGDWFDGVADEPSVVRS